MYHIVEGFEQVAEDSATKDVEKAEVTSERDGTKEVEEELELSETERFSLITSFKSSELVFPLNFQKEVAETL